MCQLECLLLEGLHTTEGRSDHDTNSLGILQGLRSITQLRIFQRLSCCSHREVCVSVVGASILWVGEVVGGVEELIGNFARDLAGIVRDVEALDDIDTGLSIKTGLEEIFMAESTARDHTETSDDDALGVVDGVQGGRRGSGRRNGRESRSLRDPKQGSSHHKLHLVNLASYEANTDVQFPQGRCC